MIDFLKERILLFVMVIAGDWVSLSNLIKADEIRHDAITIAIAVSLLPSLIISLLIEFYFQQKLSKKKLVAGTTAFTTIVWIAFIFLYLHFSSINDQYGKVPYPTHVSGMNSVDSMIVGGCHYTPEAQAEVDSYAAKKHTLTPSELFEDFNYDVSQIWIQSERDCAKNKILNSFAMMLAFLIIGITLTTETIIALRKEKSK
jgi:hypothetical protein